MNNDSTVPGGRQERVSEKMVPLLGHPVRESPEVGRNGKSTLKFIVGPKSLVQSRATLHPGLRRIREREEFVRTLGPRVTFDIRPVEESLELGKFGQHWIVQ